MESEKAEENSQHAWVMRILKVLSEFRITPCGMRNFRITWSSWLTKAISSSFQLQIVHGLKHWIIDFRIFEMVYSMKKMDFGKCSKSAKEYCSCCPLFSSLLAFPLCFTLHTLNDFGKGLCSSKAWFFMNLSFQKLCHNLSK